MFDPNTFLQQTITDANATRLTPIPEGEYLAVIDKLGIRTNDKGTIMLDVIWAVLDETVKQTLGMDKPTVKQTCFLDLDANGKLATGDNKNVQVGRVREAVGQNIAGQAWGPNMLQGAGPAKIKITLRPDKDDPTLIYNDVKGVAKAA